MPTDGSSNAMFARFTLRMARVVSRLAKHHTQAEIGKLLKLSPRIVAGDILAAETITGCATNGELARWWQDEGPGLMRFWMDDLGIDPRDVL
jgi:DNA-binding CsgD family transcriptional regulator